MQMTVRADEPDWYCDEVLPGHADIETVAQDEKVLAFRPPRRRPGIDHVIVIPRRHVRSLLELPAEDAGPVIAMVQEVARLLTGLHGGCQVITNIGTEQHNRHLHVHVVASTGQDGLGRPF
jgi:histidine triad (HIT) family protein